MEELAEVTQKKIISLLQEFNTALKCEPIIKAEDIDFSEESICALAVMAVAVLTKIKKHPNNIDRNLGTLREIALKLKAQCILVLDYNEEQSIIIDKPLNAEQSEMGKNYFAAKGIRIWSAAHHAVQDSTQDYIAGTSEGNARKPEKVEFTQLKLDLQ